MVLTEGFEPASTPYKGAAKPTQLCQRNGAPGGTRTPARELRRLLPYPTWPPAHDLLLLWCRQRDSNPSLRLTRTLLNHLSYVGEIFIGVTEETRTLMGLGHIQEHHLSATATPIKTYYVIWRLHQDSNLGPPRS